MTPDTDRLACAHRHIKCGFVRCPEDTRLLSDRWSCRDCGMEFLPRSLRDAQRDRADTAEQKLQAAEDAKHGAHEKTLAILGIDRTVDIYEHLQRLTAAEQRADGLERELVEARLSLWRGHGHEGIYGDDGELQCGECVRLGGTDYRRRPFADVVKTAIKALRQQLTLAHEQRAAAEAALGVAIKAVKSHCWRCERGDVPVNTRRQQPYNWIHPATELHSVIGQSKCALTDEQRAFLSNPTTSTAVQRVLRLENFVKRLAGYWQVNPTLSAEELRVILQASAVAALCAPATPTPQPEEERQA